MKLGKIKMSKDDHKNRGKAPKKCPKKVVLPLMLLKISPLWCHQGAFWTKYLVLCRFFVLTSLMWLCSTGLESQYGNLKCKTIAFGLSPETVCNCRFTWCYCSRWASHPGHGGPGQEGHAPGRVPGTRHHLSGLRHGRHHQRLQQKVQYFDATDMRASEKNKRKERQSHADQA